MNKAAFNRQIYAEACDWLVTFRTEMADATLRGRLDEWLRRSPEHVRAYLEVSSIWEDAALHDPQRNVSAQAHIERARAEANVFDFGHRPGVSEAGGLAGRNPIRYWSIAAAAAAAVLLAGGGLWRWSDATDTYSTAIGEQRSVSLPDGSTVNLNVHTGLRVLFSERERAVELLNGQALFQVARDPQRPFVVHSDGVSVWAVGTQFDVYKRSTGVTVTVVEGSVAAQAANVSTPVLLSAGQQLTLSAAKVAQPETADLQTATAWTQRRLVFDAVPLSEVAREFNRYNRRPLVIADAGVEDFAVVGVFSSTDPTALLKFLRAQSGIRIEETEERIGIYAAR